MYVILYICIIWHVLYFVSDSLSFPSGFNFSEIVLIVFSFPFASILPVPIPLLYFLILQLFGRKMPKLWHLAFDYTCQNWI